MNTMDGKVDSRAAEERAAEERAAEERADEERADEERCHSQRAAMYGLLARLFRCEADDALLDALGKLELPVSCGNEKLDEGHELLAVYLCNIWANSLEELSVDYSRTFVGNGMDARSAAYPYESVFTSEKHLLMQEARDKVLAAYREHGLDKSEAWQESEDHVALELEFMQALATRTAEALAAGRAGDAAGLLASQRSFLEKHLLNWVPQMAAAMRRFSKTEFYRGVSLIAEGFLETDMAALKGARGE